MKEYIERVNKAVEFLKSKLETTPKIAIVLGSGLHGIAESVENPLRISYKDIPGFPVSTAPGHKGE
ncbi:MAG: purine-nucleoside phosphorylase, partial [Geotoga sp.]|nr:purine-nucleoside phosphorylase [Geotoga sp.]